MYLCSFNGKVISQANSLKDVFTQIQHVLPQEVLAQLPPTEAALRAHSNQSSPALTVARIKRFDVTLNTEAGAILTSVVFQQWKYVKLLFTNETNDDE